MNWLNRLEARFPSLAIQTLPQIITVGNLLAWIAYKANPKFFQLLELDMNLVRQGEFWRLITFIFIPGWSWWLPETLGLALYIMYLYWITTGLQRAWGPFRFTVYYVLGMAGQAVAGIILGSNVFGNGVLNTTMLFAFAEFYPDAIIRLYFILPVKVKWAAWVSAAFLVFGFTIYGWNYRIAVLFAVGNYFLFFGRELINAARHRREVVERRQRFDREIREGQAIVLHECAVCHRTDGTNPELEFRVSRDGNEYCLDHLPRPAPTS